MLTEGSGRLVDTNAASYVCNRHSLGVAYASLLVGHTPLLSVMSVAELYRGAEEASWGARRIWELERFVRRFVVVPFTEGMCKGFAKACNASRQQGLRMGDADAIIAATALALNVPLVTHNRRHFDKVPGLQVLSASK